MGAPDLCPHGKYEDTQCDKCEIERLKTKLDACVSFIKNEMGWCDFRGEMLADNASVRNARKLAEFLDKLEVKHGRM